MTLVFKNSFSSIFSRGALWIRAIPRAIKTNSIKFKVGVLYTVVLGIILVVFSTVLYFTLSYYLYKEIDTHLKLRATETLATIRAYADIIGDKPGAFEYAVQKTFFYDPDYSISFFDMGKVKRQELKWQERADVMGLSDSYSAFLLADTKQLVTTKTFPSGLLPIFIELNELPQTPGGMVFNNVGYKKDSIRVVTMFYLTPENQRHILRIGVSQRHVVHLLHSLLQAIALGIPLVLLLTSFVGRMFVQRILDPIEEIAKTANTITHEDLTSRVQTRHLDSEIAYVVESFNDMIMRLEKSFKHINEFSSHVAHELKTPLAIIKGESELTLSKDRDAEEYRSALRINLEEADRMRATIENLLLLAKLDYQLEGFHFEFLNFTEFFKEICDQTRILASEKGLTVETVIPSEEVIINADKLHLRRLFFNLIDNALKFTPAPGEIRLQANRVDKKLVVLVADTGIGVPPEHLPKVFEKFYRADRVGEKAAGGNGLGLSIVQSIVEIHQGQIRIQSKLNEGTSFEVTLPL